MSTELDWTLTVLARVVTVYFILAVVTSAASLFLSVLTYYRSKNLLDLLRNAKVYTLPPDTPDSKAN